MDEIDRATEHTEMLRQAALDKARAKAHEKDADATGYCLYCGEELPPGRRWCDWSCMAAWDAEAKYQRSQRM